MRYAIFGPDGGYRRTADASALAMTADEIAIADPPDGIGAGWRLEAGQMVAPGQSTAPALPDISDTQFGLGLWTDGVISYEDYLGFVGPGALPPKLDALLANLPDDATGQPTPRKIARGDLVGRKTFEFAHPLVEVIRQLMQAGDPKWTQAFLRERWQAWAAL